MRFLIFSRCLQLFINILCFEVKHIYSESNQCPSNASNFTFNKAPSHSNDMQCPDLYWPNFQCLNRKSCFTMRQSCDGFDDCADSTDECDSMCRETFRCSRRNQCIAMSRFCDGVPDCDDGSDEIEKTAEKKSGFYCSNQWNLFMSHNGSEADHWKEKRIPFNSCARQMYDQLNNEFNLHQKLCRLPDQLVCDGINHCGDHSDECSPSANCDESKKFYCNNSRCIARTNVCDGKDDCGDASDECRSDCLQSFHCGDGSCIAFNQYCDGVVNCPDGSDEITHINETLHPGMFNHSVRCCNIKNLSPNRCLLPSRYLCDGEEQCVNREDECLPGCPFSFRCANSRCIMSSKICDRYDDCGDMSDECNSKCQSNLFQCNNGSCLSVDRFCDGTPDCPDGEDEDDEIDDEGFFCSGIKRIQSKAGKKICKLPQRYVCDGFNHCENRTDECERHCAHSFFCDNDTTCVPRSDLCNGEAKCKDLSDSSRLRRAASYQRGFKCKVFQNINDPKCVLPQTLVGDSIADCIDGSDLCIFDSNSTYEGDQFCIQCLHNNMTISVRHLCDGIFDCEDLSDECLCDNNDNIAQICLNVDFGTSSDMIPCLERGDEDLSLTQWIDITKFCDGIKDCHNGVDEMYCQVENVMNVEMNTNSTFQQHPASTGTMECFRFQINNPWTPRFARVCDGNPECYSMEDECDMNCEPRPYFCKFRSFTGNFKCPESDFLPGKLVCNGIIDCRLTGDDERNCLNRFYCDGGNMISVESNKVCDFSSDCQGSSDEMNCSKTHFYCDNKQPLYIRRYKVLDGVRDCTDGSDECSPDFFAHTVFSSQDFMIKQNILQGMVWIMALMAIIGNAIVCVRTATSLKHEVFQKKQLTRISFIYNLLILNLAAADFMMGIFLICLGIQNVRTKGSYCYFDRPWRSGLQCTFLGVLSSLSVEVSVLTLAILATYRLHCVLQPVKCRNIKLHVVLFWIGIAWGIGFTIALLPLSSFLQNYFSSGVWIKSNPYFSNDIISKKSLQRFCKTLYIYNQSSSAANITASDYCLHWENMLVSMKRVNIHQKINGVFGYYSAHSTCLPKIFVTTNDDSWEYSIAVTMFNFSVCLYIAGIYIFLFKRRKKLGEQVTTTNRHTASIQKRIAILIGTDFICWLPICITVFLRFSGWYVSDGVYSFTAIILLPINSSVNPFFSNKLVNCRKFSLDFYKRFKRPRCESKELTKTKTTTEMDRKKENLQLTTTYQQRNTTCLYHTIDTESSFLIESVETRV